MATVGAALTSCPKCKSTYPSDFTHCPKDGTLLARSDLWSCGSVIRGKYEILETIGSGGMATVYKARHIHFRELRALKVIDIGIGSDPTFVKRFTQEAILTRRLQHPNIVRVDDIDTAEDGRPFMVMELVEGVLLSEALKSGDPPIDAVLSIVRQVADALEAAHALGMVHRDIKPSNLVLQVTPNGLHLKVLDFGIAKVRESRHFDPMRTGFSTLTAVDIVIGTPAYMSPEQAMGKRADEIDGRADLYSLGTVMYQMLAGRLPFSAVSNLEYMLAQINTPPIRLNLLRPDLPDDICTLVMSCLEKDRSFRPQTCSEFVAVLNAAEKRLPRTQPAVPQLERVPVREELPTAHYAVEPVSAVVEKDRETLHSAPLPVIAPPVPLAPEQPAAKIIAPAPPPPSPVIDTDDASPAEARNWKKLFVWGSAVAALAVIVFGLVRFPFHRAASPAAAQPFKSVPAQQPSTASQNDQTPPKPHDSGKPSEKPQEPVPIVANLHQQTPSTPLPPPTKTSSLEVTATSAPAKETPPSASPKVISRPPAASFNSQASQPPVPPDAAPAVASLKPPAISEPIPPNQLMAPEIKAKGFESREAVSQKSPNTMNFPPGTGAMIQGVILSRNGNSLRVRSTANSVAVVELDDHTRILSKNSFVFHKNQMTVDGLMSGYHVEANGKGTAQGSLLAEKIIFDNAVSMEGDWASQSTKENVQLHFSKEGRSLQGFMNVRFRGSDAVRLDFKPADVAEGKLSWTASDGSEGIVSVKLADTNKLRVEWRATKTSQQRLESGAATLTRQ